MSIKLYARELYRLYREVENLEKELKEAPKETPLEEQLDLAERLRKAKAEKAGMRRILDGAIDRTGTPKK